MKKLKLDNSKLYCKKFIYTLKMKVYCSKRQFSNKQMGQNISKVKVLTVGKFLLILLPLGQLSIRYLITLFINPFVKSLQRHE